MNIPIYKPSLRGNESRYVNECLDSTWISSKGDFISRFEMAFSNYTGIQFASTVCNGTVALHLAMLALDIKQGDEIIVPTLTYVASVNAIKYVGAEPIFVDSNRETWQIDVNDVEERITSKTKAIMAVHLYGHPCDMKQLSLIAKRHGLYLIEDCAEAIGSFIADKHVGTFSDISTFSFFGNKTITTGEGGMVCTNDPVLFKKIYKFKNQGLHESQEYWHDVIGYNYRMTNLSAAIGLAQMERIGEILAKKREIFFQYVNRLAGKVLFHNELNGFTHSYWMCSVLMESKAQRNQIRAVLKENGIETRPLFPLVHLMPMYSSCTETFQNAEYLSDRGLNLPSYPDLSESQVDKICSFF
ncbi:DegT/DnrJ/EryC1/StrS aminotransferase family protein [uncultured Roseivirga sp.]|uniref:DegT/DnrJ/EryC1/StrS family aminotransferase n=1 Tax=uncultured Roseivirga sp. TaxID=543088 RepID=UPI0030D83505|tara:strand:- start:95747 stop:96817 length:1071 start_codon:yes stop_codon:yes gene_type:complete